MDKKISRFIWICCVLLVISFVFSIINIHGLIHEVSIGIFCSSVLVLLVEYYHEKKEKIRRHENRIVFLSKFTYEINKINDSAIERCKSIERLNPVYWCDSNIRWIKNVIEVEIPWLKANIALESSSKKKLFLPLKESRELDYDIFSSTEFNAYLVFINYSIGSFNFRDLETTLKEMNLRLLKASGVIVIDEFMMLEILLELIKEFHKYLYDINCYGIVRYNYIVHRYNLIIDQLESLYNLVEEGREENIKMLEK